MPSSFTPQQIEQFLQEFFDVVGARQYIGARYVPIFGRAGEGTVEWDDGAPYEPLAVVMHEGVSYVSRRYVPNGIQITDTDYWVETYRFNAQVEQYRQEVLGFSGRIDAANAAVDALAIEVADDYVPFPDPDHYAKYGTGGQVLSTLADGGTEWVDPVVPSDEQAEEVITQWLDDHPEATTTVQDGAISTAKLANGAVTDVKLAQTGGVLDAVDGIQREIMAFGCGTLIDFMDYAPNPAQPTTSNGVTITPIKNCGFKMAGTATSAVVAQFLATTTLPPWLPVSKPMSAYLRVGNPNANLTGITLMINVYRGGGSSTSFKVFTPGVRESFTLDADVTGVVFYVRVASGTSVNNEFHLCVNDGTPSNVELEETIEDEIHNSIEGLAVANSHNDLDPTTSPSTSQNPANGISWSKTDYGVITHSGTASASAQIQVWAGRSFPSWWAAGETKSVEFRCTSTGLVRLYIYHYDSENIARLITTLDDGDVADVKIPATSIGLAIQLRIDSGVTVDGKSTVIVNDGILSNKALTDKMMGRLTRRMFSNVYRIGVIGDSYSAIRLYVDVNGHTQGIDAPQLSWVKCLERMSGMSYENLSGSGYECSDWIDGTQDRPEKFTAASQPDKLCQLYLVCMGINDSARHDTSYVGSKNNINDADPDSNAHTFIGYYAKIIQKMRAVQPNALFCAVTMPTYTGTGNEARYEAYNKGIRDVAAHFDYVFLIDLYKDFYGLYHEAGSPLQNPGGPYLNNSHYTAEAQGMIAEVMAEEIGRVMATNGAAFANLATDGTNGDIWQPTE